MNMTWEMRMSENGSFSLLDKLSAVLILHRQSRHNCALQKSVYIHPSIHPYLEPYWHQWRNEERQSMPLER